MGSIVICKIVAATAMPTDAYPKYRAIILAIGAATVEIISTSFRKTYRSCAIMIADTTLSGKVKAEFTVIIKISRFIFFISFTESP